jgi:hypothetical protein
MNLLRRKSEAICGTLACYAGGRRFESRRSHHASLCPHFFVPSRSGLRANTAVVQRAIVDSPESQSRHAVKKSLRNTTPSFVEILTDIPNRLRKFRPQ